MARPKRNESSEEFARKYGPWALVTGAAQGIGRAYADALAQRGVNVVMVDVQHDLLSQVSRQIAEASGVQVQPIAGDLSNRDFLRALGQQTEQLSIGLLVCNAAAGRVGLFLEQNLDGLLLMGRDRAPRAMRTLDGGWRTDDRPSRRWASVS